jgi:hypothetical protein
MKQQFLLAIVMLVASQALAQKTLMEKAVPFKYVFQDTWETYPVQQERKVVLFLHDKVSIRAVKFDDQINLVDTLDAKKPARKYSVLLGHSSETDKKYSLYFSSKSHDDLVACQFDFENHKFTQTEINLPFNTDEPFNKESFAGTISHKGKFYLLAVQKNTSILHIYVFSDGANYSQYTFDFKDEHFISPPHYTMHFAINENPFETVDNNIPNAIEVTSKKNKLYCYDNTMALTFDNFYSVTKLVMIDLINMQPTFRSIKKNSPDCGNTENVSTNSYIYKKNLYLFFVCPMGMNLTMKNLESKEILNSFQVTKDQDISFKNTRITQKGLDYLFTENVERDLSKTQQFLRKVSAADAGVCAFQTSKGIEVTMGSFEKVQTARAGVGTGTGIVPGITGASQVYPTYAGYSSYITTKSVYFETLLDSTTFQHLKGNIDNNAFDKIDDFKKELKNDIEGETIFERDGALILCFYSKKAHSLIMKSFADE